MSLFHSKKKVEPNKMNEEVVFVPDHKHKNCMQCGKKFSMMHRKHHCRKCGNLVCDDCSKNRWYIETPSGKGEQRVCDACFHELSNHHPVVSNPQYQVLTQPTFISWIQTFEKSWIRSRYPKKYKKYKRQLLHGDHYGDKETTPILKNPTPSNATITSKFTPKVLEKRKSRSDDNKDSLPANKARDSAKSKYQRPQKEKYANMNTSQKQSNNNNKNVSNGPLQMSSRKSMPITRKRKYNPLVVVQTGVLYVNIMEAQGLPDCDTFSQPDGYCVYYVTNNDPCFGQTTKYSTKVQHNTVKTYIN